MKKSQLLTSFHDVPGEGKMTGFEPNLRSPSVHLDILYSKMQTMNAIIRPDTAAVFFWLQSSHLMEQCPHSLTVKILNLDNKRDLTNY